MSQYSDHPDVCKDDAENNFDDDIDLTPLDEIQYELDNPNGKASIAPPKRNEAAELAELERGLAEINVADCPDEESAPIDGQISDEERALVDTHLASLDMGEPDPSEAERVAAIKADAYKAQDEAITASGSSSTFDAPQVWRQKRTERAEREEERKRAAREAKKAANAERRRQKHAERERERRRAAREAKAAIPAPRITPAQSQAIRDEAKQRGAELIAATDNPAIPERVRRLRGEVPNLMTWLVAWRLASLKTAAHRELVPSLKTGPSLEFVARERTKLAKGTEYTRFAARLALEKLRLVVAAGIWPSL